MKKYLSIALLALFITPSIAFASWWNPLSWFNNWKFNKQKEVSEVQIENQKTPEQKIDELQKQLNELKNQQSNDTDVLVTEENNKVVPSNNNSTKIIKSEKTNDVCSNIYGIQTKTPEGYSWSYGNICSVVNLKDYCPNITGVQSKIPDGMFLYGDDKECLTQNEINYIAEKIQEEQNKKNASSIQSTDPIYSKECISAQDELEKVRTKFYGMDQTNYRDLADFTVLKMNPALDKVNRDCRLNLPPRDIKPMTSTNCYVNYYGSTASVSCYNN